MAVPSPDRADLIGSLVHPLINLHTPDSATRMLCQVVWKVSPGTSSVLLYGGRTPIRDRVSGPDVAAQVLCECDDSTPIAAFMS